MRASNFPQAAWIAAILLIAVILPRLAALGWFPHMDESMYATLGHEIQRHVSAGMPLPPDISAYQLYPCLTAWLWLLPGNGAIWLRLADLLMACAAGWAFCLMIIRESRQTVAGALLALAFLLALNIPGAIDSGFKNSFMPAFFCLFCAVNITRGAPGQSGRWFYAGALVAATVLLRETFAPFALLGAVAPLFKRDFRAFWRYAAGGIAAAIAITVCLALWRGQLQEIFSAYFSMGQVFAQEGARRLIKFTGNGLRALSIWGPLLLLATFCFLCAQKPRLNGRACFWLAAALLPLAEPYAKIGFLYHFSVCLPGLAGFCAHCLAGCNFALPKIRKKITIATALAAAIFLPINWAHFSKLPDSLATLRAFSTGVWPASQERDCQTIAAANRILALLPKDGSLSTSGFTYFLFAATRAAPPAYALSDLGRTFIYCRQDKNCLREKIDANPPDVVVLARTDNDHVAMFWEELTDFFNNHPDYEFMGGIEPDESKNYGWLGYDFYKRKAALPQ